jgi:hypothetical protein
MADTRRTAQHESYADSSELVAQVTCDPARSSRSRLLFPTNLLPYAMEPIQRILIPMESKEQKQASGDQVEYLKGCPICEHSNPQLERELCAFAQLLFDIWLAKKNGNENHEADADVDKGR